MYDELNVYKKAFELATEEITDNFGEPIPPEYIGDREIEGREERRNYFLANARKELEK